VRPSLRSDELQSSEERLRVERRSKISNLVTAEIITERILIIREKRVMLDVDVAMLYEVKIKRLNEQVARKKNDSPKISCFDLPQKKLIF
jgi:hypothetical protein